MNWKPSHFKLSFFFFFATGDLRFSQNIRLCDYQVYKVECFCPFLALSLELKPMEPVYGRKSLFLEQNALGLQQSHRVTALMKLKQKKKNGSGEVITERHLLSKKNLATCDRMKQDARNRF